LFTGIVEQVGSVVARTSRGPGARLVVSTGWTDLVLGESIAVSGVCLTVDGIRRGTRGQAFEADASAETLARSTLDRAGAGTKVNLERALRLDARLGGHLVGGHVDARGELLARRSLGEAWELRFSLPPEITRFVAPKGSIAIDGVSLTVNGVHDGPQDQGSAFDVVVIPHTLGATTLRDLPVGGPVNLEVDVLARYVARQLAGAAQGPGLPRGHEAQAGKTHDAHASADESLLRALKGAGYT
jgi:riboflavin synthase